MHIQVRDVCTCGAACLHDSPPPPGGFADFLMLGTEVKARLHPLKGLACLGGPGQLPLSPTFGKTAGIQSSM